MYHPVGIYTALLNNQPMGFWSPAVIVHDAKHHGVTIRSVDINQSDARCTVEDGAIRLGLNYVHKLGEQGAAQIVTVREAGSFRDLADFCRRVDLPRQLIENLILIGAFDSFTASRRDLLWELGQVRRDDNALGLTFKAIPVELLPFSQAEALYSEHRLLGLSPKSHIVALYRPLLTERGILGSRDLIRQPDGATVKVAGQVVMHQAPPTAKGHHFLTLEDEDGMMNIIVRPDIYALYSQVIRESPILVVEGQVQQRTGVTNLIAWQCEQW